VCGLEAHAAMVMEQDDCLSLVLFISKRWCSDVFCFQDPASTKKARFTSHILFTFSKFCTHILIPGTCLWWWFSSAWVAQIAGLYAMTFLMACFFSYCQLVWFPNLPGKLVNRICLRRGCLILLWFIDIFGLVLICFLMLQEDLKHRAEQAQKNFNVSFSWSILLNAFVSQEAGDPELAEDQALFVFHVSKFWIVLPLFSRKPVILSWHVVRRFLF